MIGYVIKDTYRIDRYLGEGGPSVVYQGTDLLLHASVAIKRLKVQASMGDGSSMAERFLREARTHARLVHQNIVGIRAVLEENHEYFIVMEYVDGGDLAHLLEHRPQQQLSVEEAILVFGQALLGLDYAHRNQVIHRDIKPSNILLTQERCAKIADFGLARAVTDHKITGTGFLVGTLTYMSPEQLQGEEADPRSDIYSLGVSLYEALAGRHPFIRDNEKPTPHEVFGRHLFDEPPLLHTVRSDVPEALAHAVARSMAKNPADRFADCVRFAEALQQAVKGTVSAESSGAMSLALAMQSGSAHRLPPEASSPAPSASGAATSSPATGATFRREETPLRPPASTPPTPSSAGRGGRSSPPRGTRELNKQVNAPLRPPAGSGTQDLSVVDDTVFDRLSPVSRAWNPGASLTPSESAPTALLSSAGEAVPSLSEPTGASSLPWEAEATSVSPTSSPPPALSQFPTPSSASPEALASPAHAELPDTWNETASPLPRGASTSASFRSRGKRWATIALLVTMLTAAGFFFWKDWQERGMEAAREKGLAASTDGGARDFSPMSPMASDVPSSHGDAGQTPSRGGADRQTTRHGATGARSCSALRGHMTHIPGGWYSRGYSKKHHRGDRDPKDAPTTRSFVSGFCLDRFEATVGEYKRCVEEGFCISIPWRRRWRWRNKSHRGLTVSQVLPAEQPMRYVRWQDAQLFCRWAHKRLPTEAEWEWAARGDANWIYPWGNQRPTCRRAVFRSCKARSPLPVSEKRQLGTNPFKVFDLSGNVAEWVRDCYDPKGYRKSKVHNPFYDAIPCRHRVVRGGSFRHRARWLRNYRRMNRPPQTGTAWIGFRCAASLRRKKP